MPAGGPVDPKLLELLVCPLTKGPLRYDRERGELVSEQAALAYPIRDGIPIMLVDEARPVSEEDRDSRPSCVPMQIASSPWPVEVRVKRAERRLEVDFDDGASFSLPAELLRVESPSAEVQGHTPSQKVTVGGKSEVGIRELDPVGNYAVRILFDDGHSTGIYTWSYLHKLGREQDQLWSAYLEALKAKGLSR